MQSNSIVFYERGSMAVDIRTCPNTPFTTFCILYMSAFLTEMTESWRHVGFSLAFLFIVSAIAFTRVTRLTFQIFLLLSTGYFLGFRFPEVANHVNFMILLNIPLILGISYSYIQPISTDEEFFERIQPFLRIALAIIYILAGFHKLNQDFFDPSVSCAKALLFTGFSPILVSKVFGIPSLFLLLVSLAISIFLLWNRLLHRLSLLVQLFLLVLLLPFSLLLSKGIVLSLITIPTAIQSTGVLALACFIASWEIIGGLLLFIHRYQGPILLVSAIMHISLGLIGFVDFSSLAFSLCFAFIPRQQFALLASNCGLSISSRRIHRVHAYYFVLVLGGILTAIHYRLGFDIGDIVFLNGLLLAIAIQILFWPILKNLASSEPVPWIGVPLWNPQTPKFLCFSLLLIVLHGITPYLGLRTAGNFSMFSNLRTEGDRSNHFLLSSNPLKIWDYQEDSVEVLEFDDKDLTQAYNLDSLERFTLPIVELKKLIYQWTQAGSTVPIYFVYRGVLHSSQDIVNDPDWASPQRDWEMYWMDFRVIQPQGPNQCRW